MDTVLTVFLPLNWCCAVSLQWRHNGLDGVSNHQPHHCLLSRLFGRRSKKTSKLRVTGLCAGNSPGTGEFPAQMASNAENVPFLWRHHVWGLSWAVYMMALRPHSVLGMLVPLIITIMQYFSKALNTSGKHLKESLNVCWLIHTLWSVYLRRS